MCDKLSFDLSSTSLRVVLTTLSVKVYFNTKPYIQFLREMVISLYNLERMNERKLPYFLLTLESDSSIILFERISMFATYIFVIQTEASSVYYISYLSVVL